MYIFISYLLSCITLVLMRIYPCMQFKLMVIENINVIIEAAITKLLVERHVVSSTQPTFRLVASWLVYKARLHNKSVVFSHFWTLFPVFSCDLHDPEYIVQWRQLEKVSVEPMLEPHLDPPLLHESQLRDIRAVTNPREQVVSCY